MELNEVVVSSRGLVSREMIEVINRRDDLLIEADRMVQIALDKNVDETPFRQYRQALRDIPQTYTNPEDVVWPQKPSLPQASV
ncbi:Tail fiber assembly protein [Vibrio crassostreae]|nr:Tail fiber assembly protein [Vibrio crassostreae]CAK1797756.1 Tail fiber assembly protein [Vibrio crassostreae]CAK2660590.1 Tail fiber assembly protein [Vibrio crassostreae]CAK3160264.1 Tail fiber assembly protein [Vibrio crassostreae]CAK3196369.1 Tail fiber assembly protein [Vibrio crassostreae]